MTVPMLATNQRVEGVDYLNASQQQLATKYIPMARSLARSFKTEHPQLADDFESAALIALTRAALHFDPGYGVKFSTYARRRIVGALKDELRARIAPGYQGDADEAPYVTSLYIDIDDGPYGTNQFEYVSTREQFGTVINATPDLPVEKGVGDADEFEHLIEQFPDEHQPLLRLLFERGLSQQEAANAMGLCRSKISRNYREAFRSIGIEPGPFARVHRSSRRRSA
jgi:RNA polymerase sigma factor (sigma-70 family)